MTFSGLTLVVRLIVKFSNEIHEFHEIAVPFFLALTVKEVRQS